METEKSLAKKETPPSFIEKLMLNSESLEQVKEIGRIIIASGFCPDHFKEKGGDPVGVVMCIEAGRQLGLTWMQALSDMYPVKGRIGIMGAGARSLIFSSGVLDKWEETTSGEFPNDTYKHIVTSKRKGLPGEFRTEFSVLDSKKAGLFGKDIYQRYGKRMLMWRAIGFHATDYYGDIMKGMKTVEELNDFDVIPGLGDTTIEKEDGTKINIQGGSKQKSSKMTDRVADKIPDNKFGDVNKDNVTDAEVVEEKVKESPVQEEHKDVFTRQSEALEKMGGGLYFKPEKGSSESMGGQVIDRGNSPSIEGSKTDGKWTLEEMEKMDTEILKKTVMEDMDMHEAAEMIGGKNTNKKLREIIAAHQEGKLNEYVAKFMPKPGDNTLQETPADTAKGEIPLNKSFDSQKPEHDDFLDGPIKKPETKVEAANKYGIEIPSETPREFSVVKGLFNKLMGITPQITTPAYMVLAERNGLLQKYPDKETFLKMATIEEINLLLNDN